MALGAPPASSSSPGARRRRGGAVAELREAATVGDGRDPVLVAEGLVKRFPAQRTLGDLIRRRPARPVEAVAGVSFSVSAGEVLAIVGESGSGKTTTANLLLGLL